MAKTYHQQLMAVQQACDMFPVEFGLYGWPASRFRVNERNSYWNGTEVMLYLDVMSPTGWVAHSKGTVAEVKAQVLEVKFRK